MNRQKLKRHELFTVQGKLLVRYSITVWKIMHNVSHIPPGEFLASAPDVGTRRHLVLLAGNHIRLEVRIRFFLPKNHP